MIFLIKQNVFCIFMFDKKICTIYPRFYSESFVTPHRFELLDMFYVGETKKRNVLARILKQKMDGWIERAWVHML